jgi:hypothetical protein
MNKRTEKKDLPDQQKESEIFTPKETDSENIPDAHAAGDGASGRSKDTITDRDVKGDANNDKPLNEEKSQY